MMKGIFLYMTMCVAAIAFAACTNELEESTVPADNALVLTVDGFPAFQETTETRAVGTFDPGKTEWTSGDKVLVRVSSNGSTTQYATLTYENNTWTTNPTLTRPEGTFTVEAWYAPTYSWDSNGDMTTSAAGTGEFLHQTLDNQSQRNIEINFSDVVRDYSRLRIAGSSGTNLNVSLTDFTPAGSETTVQNYTLTTDSKGNAYLYGMWTGSSNLDVTYGSTSLVDKNITTASVANTSYVVDASFTNISNPTTCDAIGNGTQDCPYILLNGTQLNDLATNNNANKGAQYKMAADIDLSQYSSNWTPFTFSGTFDGNGHAITSFTYSGSTQNFGLFNQNSGIIKNLIIAECSITNTNTGTGGTAAIAYNNVGTIENCHVSGTIGGYNVSGIAETNNGSIIACSNSATLSGTYVCGISRNIENGATFIGCYNTGILNGSSGYTGIWRIPLSTPTGTVTTLSCYASVGDIYNNPAMFTNNISSCYYLNNNVITDQGNGSTVADWQTAIENMNSPLQSGGYNYRYEMGTGGLPVIRRYTP